MSVPPPQKRKPKHENATAEEAREFMKRFSVPAHQASHDMSALFSERAELIFGEETGNIFTVVLYHNLHDPTYKKLLVMLLYRNDVDTAVKGLVLPGDEWGPLVFLQLYNTMVKEGVRYVAARDHSSITI